MARVAKYKRAWRQGTEVLGRDRRVWRQDACGAWIKFGQYGKRTQYGWTIDHIRPESDGGSDDTSNLQPLHHKNNNAKSDGDLDCRVTSLGEDNIDLW